MAGVKISALPTIIASQLTDIYPIVQGGITSQASLSQLATLFNANLVLASTAQVTGLNTALASFVPLAGGTMTGALILNTNSPTTALQAASKGYVDTFAAGIKLILATEAATTGNLNATAAGAGVGATLTNAGVMAAFSVDGYAASLNDRILVKNQTLTQHNGVYTVTTVGSGAANWVLTRATDYDQAAEIVPGTLVPVNNGTVNANTSWVETATVVTVDTDPVLFSQFTFSSTSFFQIANNLSEGVPATMRTNLGLTGAATMALPVSGTNGGTGVNNGASTITIGGNVTFSGAFTFTGTITANTSVTFPTSGTLLTSAQPTINQPNIVGVTTNSNAAAGSVGEDVSSVVLAGAGVALTSGVIKDITSIALTAGDWDVYGNIGVTGAAGTTITILTGWINTSSSTAVNGVFSSTIFYSTANTLGANSMSTVVPFLRVSLAAPGTVYLSCTATFAVNTMTAFGQIEARRRR